MKNPWTLDIGHRTLDIPPALPRCPRWLGGALVIASLTLTACGGSDPAEESPGDPPRRIISLIPSATETLLALGAADRLVARTDYDTQPRLAHLPSVGRGLTPSLEELTVLDPDLVVAWPDNLSRSVEERLGDLGIQLYTPEAQSLEDVYRTTRDLGRLLDLEERADSLIASIRRQLDAVESAVAGLDRPTVFYMVWHEPPSTAGPGTYIHQLIEIAGGANAFADAPGLWPQVSLEELVRRDPDVIIVPHGEGVPLEAAELGERVGWRKLRAVRRGDVVTVDAFLFNRPGPRVGLAARRLAAILHPERASGPADP